MAEQIDAAQRCPSCQIAGRCVWVGAGWWQCNECRWLWTTTTGPVTALELLVIARMIASAGAAGEALSARLRRAADELAALERPTEGCVRILAERRRQIAEERFSLDADVDYQSDELAKAAACYALPITDQRRIDVVIFGGAPEGWPFPTKAWKPAPVFDAGEGQAAVRPSDRIRELEKAGALIAAEIDRLSGLITKEPTA
jgi:hypothetical protein